MIRLEYKICKLFMKKKDRMINWILIQIMILITKKKMKLI